MKRLRKNQQIKKRLIYEFQTQSHDFMIILVQNFSINGYYLKKQTSIATKKIGTKPYITKKRKLSRNYW